MTSMTSGSPSAMSNALARRLSKRWRCTWESRTTASVRRRDRLGELVVEAPHLLVGEPLPALAEDDQAEGEREHQCHDQADRHQVAVEPRRDRGAGHHGRQEDQRERAEGDDRAEQAEALRLRDLPAPFLLCDHVSPIPSDAAAGERSPGSCQPGLQQSP